MGSHETVEVATTSEVASAAITHVWLGSHPLPHDYRLHLRVDESLTPVPPRERRTIVSREINIRTNVPVWVELDTRNPVPVVNKVVTAHHHVVIQLEVREVGITDDVRLPEPRPILVVPGPHKYGLVIETRIFVLALPRHLFPGTQKSSVR
jgi:ribosomal protein S17